MMKIPLHLRLAAYRVRKAETRRCKKMAAHKLVLGLIRFVQLENSSSMDTNAK